MTTYSELFPDDAVLIRRYFLKTDGAHNRAAPAGSNIVRVAALGCGGQGEFDGGGGAMARSKVACVAGENFYCWVGDTQTASTPGDSFVRRVNASGELLVYADRGRGSGEAGLASRSFGQLKRDGTPGTGGIYGKPAPDADLFAPLNFSGRTSNRPPNYTSGSPGSGGKQFAEYNGDGNYVGNHIGPGGFGLVVLEFFQGDPGYV